MDAVGSFSAIAAIAGLTYKVYKSLSDLLYNLATAPDYLVSLRSQVLTFAIALKHLKNYYRAAGQLTALPDSSIQEVREAIRGGEIVIKQLDYQLAGFRIEETRTAKGDIIRKAPALDRFQSVLDEKKVSRWSNQLGAHCVTLQLLLKAQELDHSLAWAKSPDDSDDEPLTPTSDTDLSPQGISQPPLHDQSVSTKELELFGQSYVPDQPQDAAESDEPKPNSMFGSFVKRSAGKFRDKIKDGSMDLRQQYRRILSSQSEDVNRIPLRVVVLGRGGAGKSKLSSNVCGLPYQDDGFDGKKTPPEQIWKKMNLVEKSRQLELHDSGGLEGPKTTRAVKDYFAFMQKAKEIHDQIHAVWYMIPCQDPFRAVQETDELFLSGELVDTGEIPIFVVFTQYDLFVDKYVRKHAEAGATEEHIQHLAQQVFRDKIQSKAMAAVKDNTKVSYCCVGLREDGSEYHGADGEGPPFGTNNLVEQMESRLRNGYLQIQWVAIQQKDDRAKLYDSVSMSVALLWTAREVAKFSYLPAVCLIGLECIYSSILNIAGQFWKIKNWGEGMSSTILRATFGLSKSDLFFSKMGLLYNVVGNLSTLLISRIALQMIVGVNLVGRRLFRLQNPKNLPALTQEMIETEILNFQESDDRKRMAAVITSARMGQINYQERDRVEQVIEVAKEALEASVGYVDASFFTKERMRVMKELSLANTSRKYTQRRDY